MTTIAYKDGILLTDTKITQIKMPEHLDSVEKRKEFLTDLANNESYPYHKMIAHLINDSQFFDKEEWIVSSPNGKYFVPEGDIRIDGKKVIAVALAGNIQMITHLEYLYKEDSHNEPEKMKEFINGIITLFGSEQFLNVGLQVMYILEDKSAVCHYLNPFTLEWGVMDCDGSFGIVIGSGAGLMPLCYADYAEEGTPVRFKGISKSALSRWISRCHECDIFTGDKIIEVNLLDKI